MNVLMPLKSPLRLSLAPAPTERVKSRVKSWTHWESPLVKVFPQLVQGLFGNLQKNIPSKRIKKGQELSTMPLGGFWVRCRDQPGPDQSWKELRTVEHHGQPSELEVFLDRLDGMERDRFHMIPQTEALLLKTSPD